jgi:prepilin-type N-terminal cleavage/methylation domain-containing protein
MISRRNSPVRAFTLVEMLVSMAVLVLLILMVAQIMNGATKTTGTSRQRLDADSEARMVFDRMASDFARLVNRKDVDFLFTPGANDQLFFFSEAPAVTPTSATTADPAQPVALVGYRINPDYQLERLGKGLTWGGTPPDGMVFLTYPPSAGAVAGATPTPTPAPDINSTLKGAAFSPIITAASGSANSAYHVIGENVFRLEFSFLLKPYTDLNGVLQAAAYSSEPFNATHPAGNRNGIGLSDVQAIVVTLALMDGRSRKLVSSSSALSGIVGGAFSGKADTTTLPAKRWEANIDNLASAGIPQAAASQIRVYQRVFFLNSAVN